MSIKIKDYSNFLEEQLLLETEEYRERECATWEEVGQELGVSKPGAMKIGDRALMKLAMFFLANQVNDLIEKYETGTLNKDEYKTMLDMLIPIKEKAKNLVKKPEFVEYFKSSYFGTE